MQMKNGGLALAWVAAVAWQMPAVADTSTFDLALKTHLLAIEKRDWAGFDATLTDSDTLSFVLASGKFSKTKADFRKATQAWLTDPDWSWSYQVLSKSSNANTGVAVLDVQYSDKNAAGLEYRLHYLLSLVFSKEQGGWRLVHDQNTLVSHPSADRH
ncbi:YybH family protein [Paucibacter sp. Y2R2-4]|uniref:YybH family protein n=1 Tax=Paucibacter sp. Y2R2-4 TaxID=2893553 RepID=UPI0021E375D0|nr:nuclear transport factor 2 family protein [Paucibacter sp. Y2R2-4]MCV2350542.1 nuclear transport factor 2 family protein [Paucibacter sp. Y2R2-4]